jgi:cysteine-rich repeat protein
MKRWILIVTACALPFLASCTCGGGTGGGPGGEGEDAWLHPDYPDVLIPWDGPVCGNTIREDPEECDDGNRRDCDGCSRNCLLETGECAEDDGGSDGDEVDLETDGVPDGPPLPPEPSGGLVPIETPEGDSTPMVATKSGRLRVLWTGSYYSILFRGSGDQLRMLRFDAEGVVISPTWSYEPVNLDIASYDYCWNGYGFGLLWADGPSVYILLLDHNGKLVRGPILICENCFHIYGIGPFGNVRIGCGENEYLASWLIEVELYNFWRWLQKLSGDVDLLDGVFIGRSYDTQGAPGTLFSHGEGWRFIHETKEIDPFPDAPGWDPIVLDGISRDLAFEWRSILSIEPPTDEFDVGFDVSGDEAAIAFQDTDASYYLARIDLDDGSVRSTDLVEGLHFQVASIGDGRVALLRELESCYGVGPECVVLSIVDEGGLESERVVVSPLHPSLNDCYRVSYDVVWTGSELGVIMALPTDETGWHCNYYLQRYNL